MRPGDKFDLNNTKLVVLEAHPFAQRPEKKRLGGEQGFCLDRIPTDGIRMYLVYVRHLEHHGIFFAVVEGVAILGG